MQLTYYNEIDTFRVKWLKNLCDADHIHRGYIDDRSINEVTPQDIQQYKQCHFFAGIGGWSYALKLAGWPDDAEVWTGSCPCQPFSASGYKHLFGDKRHLWPKWHALIKECRPPVIFGEQVAGPDGIEWFSRVHIDLEKADYTVGATTLRASGVGARHHRERLYFLAHSNGSRLQGSISDGITQGQPRAPPAECGMQSLRSRLPDVPSPVSCRHINGLSRPVDLLKSLGDAVVPQVGALFIKAAMLAIGIECERAPVSWPNQCTD